MEIGSSCLKESFILRKYMLSQFLVIDEILAHQIIYIYIYPIVYNIYNMLYIYMYLRIYNLGYIYF